MQKDQSIFVVDDHNEVYLSIVGILSDAGHNYEAFVSPQKFLARYRPGLEGCLILDTLSDANGALDLQRRIRERRWPLGTIFVVQPEDAQTAVTAMKQGASEILLAPISRKTLLKTIGSTLAACGERHDATRRKVRLQARLKRLSPRELQVMTHLVAGHQTKEIARELDIAPRTVKAHRTSIRQKMKATCTARIIRIGIELGLDRGASAMSRRLDGG